MPAKLLIGSFPGISHMKAIVSIGSKKRPKHRALSQPCQVYINHIHTYTNERTHARTKAGKYEIYRTPLLYNMTLIQVHVVCFSVFILV